MEDQSEMDSVNKFGSDPEQSLSLDDERWALLTSGNAIRDDRIFGLQCRHGSDLLLRGYRGEWRRPKQLLEPSLCSGQVIHGGTAGAGPTEMYRSGGDWGGVRNGKGRGLAPLQLNCPMRNQAIIRISWQRSTVEQTVEAGSGPDLPREVLAGLVVTTRKPGFA